jgi:hypothetical protein
MKKATAILSITFILNFPALASPLMKQLANVLVISTFNQDDKLTLNNYYNPDTNSIEPNAPGYTLPLDLNDIVNYSDVDSQLDLTNIDTLLEQNGFVIIEHDFGWYDPNRLLQQTHSCISITFNLMKH